MEEKFVPVFYDDELVPNKLIKIVKFISSEAWLTDYSSLINLEVELNKTLTNFKGIHHTNTSEDKVSLYSK